MTIHRTLLTISALVIAAAVFSSCSKEPLNQGGTAPTISYKISIVSGNNQNSLVDAPFPQPLRVFVTDENGVKQGAVRVQFEIIDGNARLSASDVATDAQGYAEVTLTPTTLPGDIRVRAKVYGSTAEVNFFEVGK